MNSKERTASVRSGDIFSDVFLVLISNVKMSFSGNLVMNMETGVIYTICETADKVDFRKFCADERGTRAASPLRPFWIMLLSIIIFHDFCHVFDVYKKY